MMKGITIGVLLLSCFTSHVQTQGKIPESNPIGGFVLGLLQNNPGVMPDLKDNINPALFLNQSQLTNVNQFIQQLMTSVLDTTPQNLTDVLDALNTSGLAGSTDNTTSLNKNQTAFNLKYSTDWHQCQVDITLMMQGAINGKTWALQMLDSSAKPGSGILRGNTGFMGNYKQCQKVSHPVQGRQLKGNICRLRIPDPVPNIPRIRDFTFDLCLPKSCRDSDLNLLFYQNSLKLRTGCTKDLDMASDPRAIVAITILALFGALMIAGTVVEIFIALRKPSEIRGIKGDNNNHTVPDNHDTSFDLPGGGGKMEEVESSRASLSASTVQLFHGDSDASTNKAKEFPTRWQQALLAFSVPRNTEKILSVKSTPGSIGCLHGIRVLSLGWVILGHLMLFGVVMGNAENTLDVIENLFQSVASEIIPSAYLAVDTFFVLGGLLTAYLFLKKLGEKGRITIKEFILYYVHRYWRLTPSLAIWIMVVACLITYVGEGRPAWSDYPVAERCQERWWINLLYFNNVYKRDGGCLGVTWYLACDMQFYVVAPLVLVPWLYGKKMIGFIMASVFVCIHLITNLALQIKYDASHFKNINDYDEYIYFRPYTRVGPYAIGLMLGWVLWKTKCEVRMNKCLVLLGWIICFGVILFISLVRHGDHRDLKEKQLHWSTAASTSYETLSKPVWALAVSWVIFACATGHGGYVNSILSWEGWQPLSRLSYSAYLVHLTIIIYEAMIPEYKYLMTTTSLAYNFIGYFVMSYAVGFLLTITVESPALGLEKVILR